MLEFEIIDETETLETHKSSLEPNSTADGEIFSSHILRQNQKSLTDTESLETQKSSRELVPRITQTSSAPKDYVRIRNH